MKLNWKSSLIACASFFLLFLAIHYWTGITDFLGIVAASASTLVLGAIIAYIVNILMKALEKRIAPRCRKPLWLKAKRPVCMLLSFVILLLVIVLLVQLIVPQLVECFNQLINSLVQSVPDVMEWLEEHVGTLLQDEQVQNAVEAAQQTAQTLGEPAADASSATEAESILEAIPTTAIGWRSLLEKYAQVLLTGVGGVMNFAFSTISSLMSTIVTLFIGLVFAINILAGKEKIASQFDRLFARIFGNGIMLRLRHVVAVLDDCFHAYIVGQLTEAVILGGLCAIGMTLFRMDYALMIGTLIGVTALIPIAGAYIGAAIGAIMLFSVSHMQALGFLVFILVLQQIEGNVIYPRTVGNSLHLPGIWVLAAVTIGGGVMGIAGMLLFVPLTAAAYRLIGEWVREEGKPSLAEKITSFGSEKQESVLTQASIDVAEPTQTAVAPASEAENVANAQANRSKRRSRRR